jgi:chromosome segregation ATPase
MNCPQCRKELRVRAEYLNRRVTCNQCQHTFTVTGAPAPSPVASAPEVPNLAPRVEALEQELRQSQAALDAAQAERRTAAQQLELRQQELEQARARLKESEAALEQARQQLQQGAVIAQQRDEALAERDRLRADAEPLKEKAARADILEKELDAERSAVAGLREELRTSQATFQSQTEATQKTLTRIRGERSYWKIEVQRLTALVKEQETFRQERDRLGSELAEVRAAMEQTATRLQAESRTVEELRSALQALQRSLEETTAGRDKAQQTLAEQRECWDAERTSLLMEWEAKLHDQQQEAAEQLRHKGEECDRDRQRWEQQTAEAREQSQRQVAGLEAEIERLTQESGQRQRDHSAALERIEELVRERNQLTGRAEDLQRNSAEAEQRWQSETARLNEDLDTLRRSQAELQQHLEEVRGQLDQERATLTTAADDARRQAATHREERDAALRWQTETARLSDELNALGRRHGELQQHLEEARGQLDQERVTLTAAADDARRQAATHREERDTALRWQTEAARLSDELDTLGRRHGELQQHLEEARGRLDQERVTLTTAADDARRQAATHREERDAALRWQTEAARLSDELNALGRRHAELQDDVVKVRGQLDSERLVLRGEATGLEEKLGAALHRAEHLEKEHDHAVAQFGEAEKRWRAEIDALSLKLVRAAQQHDETDQRGRDLQARLEPLGAEVDALRQSQAQLRRELTAREQEVEAAQEALKQARASAPQEFSQEEKERLQAELAQAQTEVTRLREALQGLGIVIRF